MSQKVKEGKKEHLGNHGFIKIIVADALNKLRATFHRSKFMDDRGGSLYTSGMEKAQNSTW